MKKLPPFKRSSPVWLTTPSGYEWARNYLGLMPLRASCTNACWLSEPAWTEWKHYSLPQYSYVMWLPGSIPLPIFRSATLGTRSLFVSANQQHEMSTQARKNVQQLQISKCLTCDALNVTLTAGSVSAMTLSIPSDCVIAGFKTFEPTASRSSGSSSSSFPWSDEHSDPLQDMRDLMERASNGLHS